VFETNRHMRLTRELGRAPCRAAMKHFSLMIIVVTPASFVVINLLRYQIQ